MRTNLGRMVIRKSDLKNLSGFAKMLETKHIEMDAEEAALVAQYLEGKMTKEALEKAIMALPIQ